MTATRSLYQEMADALREQKPQPPKTEPHLDQELRFMYRVELEQWRRDVAAVAGALAADNERFNIEIFRKAVDL